MGAGNKNNYIPKSNSSPFSGGNSAPRGKGNGGIMPSGSRSTRGSRNSSKRPRGSGRGNRPKKGRGGKSATTSTTRTSKTASGGVVARNLGKKVGLKPLLSKGAGYFLGGAAIAILDLLLFPDSVNDYNLEDWVANPGEQETLEKAPPPSFEGGQCDTLYRVTLKSNDGDKATLVIDGPIVDVSWFLDGKHYVSATNTYRTITSGNYISSSDLSSYYIDVQPEFGQPDNCGNPPPKPDVLTESTINLSSIPKPERPTLNNPPPSNIRPAFPSNRTAEPSQSDYYAYPSQEPPIVKEATTKTPPPPFTDDDDRPRTEFPSATNTPAPKPPPPKKYTDGENPDAGVTYKLGKQKSDETDSEPNIISETKVIRADGTIETTIQREATEEEMKEFNKNLRDVNRKIENAQDVIEQDRKQREITIDHPELEVETEFDKFAREFREKIEETTRYPFGKVDWYIRSTDNEPDTKSDNSKRPPEPDEETEETPFIPPPPVIQNKSPECKGCSKKILNKLDGLNLGLQGADLLLVREIHSTVHSSTHGLAKIQSFAETAWKATKADKIMAGVSMAMTVHNGMMLSNNLLGTVSEALNMTLNALNIRDETDSPIDIGAAVKDKIESILTSLVGAENYAALTARIAKANRIYQTGINILDTTYALFDSARTVSELTAGNMGKIGNALREAGTVYEDAYNEMLERVNPQNAAMRRLDTFTDVLDNAENVFSTINQVSSEVVEFKENVVQLREEKQALAQEIEAQITVQTEEKQAAKSEAQTTADIDETAFDAPVNSEESTEETTSS